MFTGLAAAEGRVGRDSHMSDSPRLPLRRFDATLALDESVRMPRTSWTIHSLRLTEDRLQRLSHLGVCAHSLTHLDLSTAYPPLPTARSGHNHPKDLTHPQPATYDCTILNFLDKSWIMEDALGVALRRAGVQGRLPSRPIELWTRDEYVALVRQLAIHPDHIIALLREAGASRLRDRVVVLYTGWRVFVPLYKDCGDPHWWAWHPFLLHPYLTQQTAAWLTDAGVCGLGTDAPSVDTPLRHWLRLRTEGMEAPWACVRELVAEASAGMALDVVGSAHTPAHRIFLGSGRFLLESMNLRSEILYMETRDYAPAIGPSGIQLPKCTDAQMTVLPFSCKQETDAILAYVLLFPVGKA